jgi:hypothetical protein
VLSRWQGGFAALIVTLLTGLLVILDVTDEAMRRWWAGHALGSSTPGPKPWRPRRPSS